MSPSIIGIFGIVLLLLLLFLSMPVDFSMAFLGLAGFCFIVSVPAGLNLLAKDYWGMFLSGAHALSAGH